MGCCGSRTQGVQAVRKAARKQTATTAAVAAVVEESVVTSELLDDTLLVPPLPVAKEGQNPQTVGNRARWVIKGRDV